MTPESTALTLPERASVALGSKDYEIKLAELVKSSVRIVEIKNADGYKEAHGARMALKTTRVAIEKAGKMAREDATAFSKAVIAEERRLCSLIEPEETRLQTLQDEWDAAREAERQAKLRAEQERIEAHRDAIDWIRAYPVRAAQLPSEGVQSVIDSLAGLDVGADKFEEFAPAADKAKSETLAALRDLHAAALAREAEAARLQAEREELARLRAEQEARDAAERARIAGEQKAEADRLAAERAQFAAEQRAAREKQAELDRQAAAARRLADEKAAAERAEADRKAAAERAEAEAILRQAREAEERRIAAERAEAERIAEESRQAEAARLAAEKAKQDAIDAERRAAVEKTHGIRRGIDAHLDLMTDDQLTDVLQFVSALMDEPKREAA